MIHNPYKRLLALVITHKYISLGILIFLIWFVFSLILSLMHPDLSLPEAFWSILVFLTSGLEDEGLPGGELSAGGRVLAIAAVLLGALIIGGFIATLASDLIRNIVHGQYVTPKPAKISLAGHVVISGYSDKTKNIIRELRSPVLKKHRAIVLVTEEEEHIPIESKADYKNIYSIYGTLIKDEFMDLADLRSAGALIILNEGEREAERADARIFLTALATRSYCEDLHIICELKDNKNIRHLRQIGISEIIRSRFLTPPLMAQAVQSPGAHDIFMELLTFNKEGNEVYRLPVPERLRGSTFAKAASTLLEREIILVGLVRRKIDSSFKGSHIKGEGTGMKKRYYARHFVNPPPKTKIRKNDKLLVISWERPKL